MAKTGVKVENWVLEYMRTWYLDDWTPFYSLLFIKQFHYLLFGGKK
jgi:hypothetical protein